MRLAWRLLRADWRAGELRLLLLALLLSITLVSGLTAFSERLQLMLIGESSQLLAADRALQSPREIDPAWLQKAQEIGLKQAVHVSFQSMLYAGDEPLLVSAKAASASYPLKGQIKLRHSLFGQTVTSAHGPPAGEAWAEAGLFSRLGLKLGDQVFIGDAPFTLSAELVSEPDRGAGSFSMGPRVLLNWQDVPATGVVKPGSRLRYQYLFAGSGEQIKAYENWLLPQLTDSYRWLDLENSQPTVAVALQRAKRFFMLASSIVIVLASVAVAMASQRYGQRHIQHVAVMKTLGAPSHQVLRTFVSLLMVLLLLALFGGWLCAYLLQQLILQQAAQTLQVDVPPLTLWPFALGFLSAVISVACFALPPFWRLQHVPAVSIFQQLHRWHFGLGWPQLLVSLTGLAMLLLLYTRQPLMAGLLLLSLLLVLGLILLPARWLLRRLHTVGMQAGSWMSLASANLRRHLFANALQMALLAISLMLLVVLWGVRDNLFDDWQRQLPERTPNFFLVNMTPEQLPAIQAWFDANRIATEAIYPMVRGRLVDINGEAVRTRVSKETLKRAGADRELNLSWSEALPPDNSIESGSWWNETNRHTGVSVESRLAERLGIKLGDTLTFMLAAERFNAEVVSLRKVEWDRMRPNFYMLFTETQLSAYPKNYMTSFWLADERHALVAELLQQYPTLVLIEVGSLIKQIQAIITHVSHALQLVFVFVLAGSILVMVATIQNSLDQRLRENTVIRALGGTRRLIVGALLGEFALLGLLAGLLATIAAELVLLALQHFLLNIPLQLHPGLWWVAPLLGSLLAAASGYLSAVRVVNTRPIQLLRDI